ASVHGSCSISPRLLQVRKVSINTIPGKRGRRAMAPRQGLARRHVVHAAALAAVFAFYGLARLPTLGPDERLALARRFAFDRLALPRLPGAALADVRQVHPSVSHFAAWVSSVGAAAALTDLDGNGLADDVCWVDPRVDRVMVAPAPGTGDRFPLFTLDPAPLP